MFAVLDDENLAILSDWKQTSAKHRPVQVKNISNLIHPATVSSAAKPSLGILLKTWMSTSTPWLVDFSPPQGKHHPSWPAGNFLPHAAQKLLAFAARQHCQDMVNLVLTSDTRASSDHLIFIQPALCLYLCFILFLSRCGTSNFLSL